MIERVGERAGAGVLRLQPARAGPGRKGPGRRGGRRVPDARPGRLRAPEGLGVGRAPEPARLPAGGDRLMAATRTRPPLFVAELHRASAQRGRLDPLFQDLSDHWTLILQRLYPVWALIGPGLSDPGHIEIALAHDLPRLRRAARPARADRRRSSSSARAVLRCFGVALHETFHAKHTKRWAVEHDLALAASSDPAERQLAVDRRLLEEPRMEAHGVRELPGRERARALRAARAAGRRRRRDPAALRRAARCTPRSPAGRSRATWPGARASTCRRARTTGSSTPACSPRCAAIWRQVLGDARPAGARRPVRPAGVDRRRRARRARPRRARLPRDHRRARPAARRRTRQASGGARRRSGPARRRTARTTADQDGRRRRRRLAGRRARARARARARRPARAARRGPRPRAAARRRARHRPTGRAAAAVTGPACRAGGCPTAASTARPFADEIQQARRYATRLRQAITHGTRQIDKRTPGGRFDGRAYARGQAQRASRPARQHPPVARSPARSARRSRRRTSG